MVDLFEFYTLRSRFDELSKHKVDVIHVHGLTAAAVARILGEFFAVRTMMSIQGIFNPANDRLLLGS